jgi:hypothetical protein
VKAAATGLPSLQGTLQLAFTLVSMGPQQQQQQVAVAAWLVVLVARSRAHG